MKINLKQPRYVLPLILLPFFFLFFFVWRSMTGKPGEILTEKPGLNSKVADVSPEVRKKRLTDKLDAYRNAYKEADGLSAVNMIPSEKSAVPSLPNVTNKSRQQKTLDSIDQVMKMKFSVPKRSPDAEAAVAINRMAAKQQRQAQPVSQEKEKSPMEMFKQQLAYMDSLQKQNDPSFKSEKLKKEQQEKLAREKAAETKLSVTRSDGISTDFNTVMPGHTEAFISAVVDENVTGYAGSRLRLRLLEDVRAGNITVPKGTLLYALINGFSGQRVTLKVTSILIGNKILPVKLDVYDLDGLPGLYVPSSAFRDFTKDLGSNSVQGVSIDNASGSFVMSSVGRMFQSTSSAIADMIRKNKAKIKFNSYLYLIDTDDLQNAQKKY